MFNSGKNGVSAHEIHRTLGVTYKTAWFMMHRLREAMDELNPALWAAKANPCRRMKRITATRPSARRAIARAIVTSQRGRAGRAQGPSARVPREPMQPAKRRARSSRYATLHRTSELHTDESRLYTEVGKEFAAHKTVEHGCDRRRASMSARTARQLMRSKISSATSNAQ